MLRDLEHYERKNWFYKWDRIFKEDNPRYQHDKFKEFVFKGSEKDIAEYRKRVGIPE